MQKLFKLSERFSRSLDEVRGQDRKNQYFRQARAWIKVSSARRAAVKGLAYSGIGLIISTIGVALFRRIEPTLDLPLPDRKIDNETNDEMAA